MPQKHQDNYKPIEPSYSEIEFEENLELINPRFINYYLVRLKISQKEAEKAQLELSLKSIPDKKKKTVETQLEEIKIELAKLKEMKKIYEEELKKGKESDPFTERLLSKEEKLDALTLQLIRIKKVQDIYLEKLRNAKNPKELKEYQQLFNQAMVNLERIKQFVEDADTERKLKEKKDNIGLLFSAIAFLVGVSIVIFSSDYSLKVLGIFIAGMGFAGVDFKQVTEYIKQVFKKEKFKN